MQLIVVTLQGIVKWSLAISLCLSAKPLPEPDFDYINIDTIINIVQIALLYGLCYTHFQKGKNVFMQKLQGR